MSNPNGDITTVPPINCIGQLAYDTSGSNGDSGYTNYFDANNVPIHQLSLPNQISRNTNVAWAGSPDEAGIGCGFSQDTLGNMYLIDGFNHRIIKIKKSGVLNSSVVGGIIPIKMWGQYRASPPGIAQNQGGINNSQYGPTYKEEDVNLDGAPNSIGLYFQNPNIPTGLPNVPAQADGVGNVFSPGISADPNGTFIWVADLGNSRVLRFPDSTFPNADVVLGAPNFTTRVLGHSSGSNPARFRGPSDVKISPTTGKLYVADPSNHRVLVFTPPFTTNMAATEFGLPPFYDYGTGTWNAGLSDNTFKKPISIAFDPTEPNRVWILDNGYDQATARGFPTQGAYIWLLNESNGSVVQKLNNGVHGNNSWSQNEGTGGTIGIDVAGSVVITVMRGENTHNALYYKKSGGSIGASVNPGSFAAPNVPIKIFPSFGDTRPNNVDSEGKDLGHLFSVDIMENKNLDPPGQLIVAEAKRLLFWNTYSIYDEPGDFNTLTTGKAASGCLGGNFLANLPGEITAIAVDGDNAHLWVAYKFYNTYPLARIMCYLLPLTVNSQPIATVALVNNTVDRTPILPIGTIGGNTLSPYVPDPNQDIFWGILPNHDSTALWVSQFLNNRVFRIRNPLASIGITQDNDGLASTVNFIIGQPNATETSPGTALNKLDNPGALSMDKLGNLYVSDGALEAEGNRRLLMFSSAQIAGNPYGSPITIGPTAVKSWPTEFSTQVAFNSRNNMIVPHNYFDQTSARPPGDVPGAIAGGGAHFPAIYLDPINGSNAVPDDFIRDFYSMPLSAVFDSKDNLYIADENRSRVMIYDNPIRSNVDPTVPTAPILSPPYFDSRSRLTFSWLPSTDDVGIVSYQILIRQMSTNILLETIILSPNNLSYIYNGYLGPLGTRPPGYTYVPDLSIRIAAYDGAGNFTLSSAQTTANPVGEFAGPPIDAIPPTSPRLNPLEVVLEDLLPLIRVTWTPGVDDVALRSYSKMTINNSIVFDSAVVQSGVIIDVPVSIPIITVRIQSVDTSGNTSLPSNAEALANPKRLLGL